MKFFILLLLFFYFFPSSAQRMNVEALETILYSSVKGADSLLQQAKFKLADKEPGKGYHNYYYTSYEKKDNNRVILRSVSFMDVYVGKDTTRLLLFRTYHKADQEEMRKLLLSGGYVLTRRSDNNYFYKKGNFSIINRISEKQGQGYKPVTAYEFEMGR